MAAYLHLSHYGVLKITGDDAETYLQGQITNDVTQLTEENVQIACQCDAKGKIWSVFYLLKHHDAYLLIGPKDSLSKSHEALKKFAVFSKVDITDASDTLHLYGLFNGGLPDKPMSQSQTSEGRQFRLPGTSTRLILITDAPNLAAPETDQLTQWKMADIAEGIPFISGDVSGEYVPQMLNVQALDGISFTKGCYMGQETVARTKYLGKNKRAGYILKGEFPLDIATDDAIERQLGDNWRRAGTIANHVWDQQDKTLWVFGVLPNDIKSDTILRLKSQPDVRLTIQPLPYSLEE